MKPLSWMLFASLIPALASATPLPIQNDDFARAQAEAKARKVPIFVEVWAPW